MSQFLSAVHSIRFDLGGDHDRADKLSCRYSIILMVVFCVVVSTKQYVGDPIDCWVPGTFTLSMRHYTDNMCWIKNTYYIPLDERIPNTDEEIRQSEINYYQWVPIVLILQALFFYFPYMIWKALNHRSGCDLKHVVKVLSESSMINQDMREKTVNYVTSHINRFVQTREKPRKNRILEKCARHLCIGKKYGNFMITTYFITKILYLGNACAQFVLLNAFIGGNYAMYGIDIIMDLLDGKSMDESRRFPRATLCSFYVREFGGNTHRHTVQCVLPINVFNEKIYLFQWFWLVFLTIITFTSLYVWVWDITTYTQVQFVKNYVKMSPSYVYDRKKDKLSLRAFANDYMR